MNCFQPKSRCLNKDGVWIRHVYLNKMSRYPTKQKTLWHVRWARPVSLHPTCTQMTHRTANHRNKDNTTVNILLGQHWRTPQRNLTPKNRLQNIISSKLRKTWSWEYSGSSKKSSKYLNWTGANKVTEFPARKTLVHLKCPNQEGDEDNTSELYTQPADNEEHQHQTIRNHK